MREDQHLMAFMRRAGMRAKQVEPGLFGLKLVDGSRGSRSLSLVCGWLSPRARHSPHTHDVEEAVVFLQGQGVVELAGQRHDVRPGDAVHIPPGVEHSTLNTGEDVLCFVAAFADNLITQSALQTAGHGRPADMPCASPLRHRLSWLLRRLADRLSPRPPA